jgi:hypothetical protein
MRAPAAIEIEITSAYIDDREGSPTEGRSQLEFRIASNVEFKRPLRYLLGFRIGQPENIRQKDGNYTIMCGLDPFSHVKAVIAPFELIFDNLGEAQLGCYIVTVRPVVNVV